MSFSIKTPIRCHLSHLIAQSSTQSFHEEYRLAKERLLLQPKGRQFDFDEGEIFGKFDYFCRRLLKLIDVFSTIEQFRNLADHRLEGMSGLTDLFFEIVEEFKSKGHDLLDYRDTQFAMEYVQFNLRIGDLEKALQNFINSSFENITR